MPPLQFSCCDGGPSYMYLAAAGLGVTVTIFWLYIFPVPGIILLTTDQLELNMKKVTITLIKTGQTQTVTCEETANIYLLLDSAAKDFGLKPFVFGKSRMSSYYGRFQVKEEKVTA